MHGLQRNAQVARPPLRVVATNVRSDEDGDGGLEPIRALGRGLSVLRAVSTGGSMTTAEVARDTALPYPTVCRILSTLVDEGFIEREPARKRYRVTEAVLGLSYGYQSDNRIVAAARPHLIEATSQLKWPFVLSTRSGASMVVRDSTHSLTSLTLHHYYPGYAFPILDSAAGRAYLAGSTEQQRSDCLDAIALMEGEQAAHAVKLARQPGYFDEMKQSGIAHRARNTFAEPVGRNSAIAAPIYLGDRAVGALALVFFASAMSAEEAITAFGNTVIRRAQAISDALADDDA